jgi:hypothetical protein
MQPWQTVLQLFKPGKVPHSRCSPQSRGFTIVRGEPGTMSTIAFKENCKKSRQPLSTIRWIRKNE